MQMRFLRQRKISWGCCSGSIWAGKSASQQGYRLAKEKQPQVLRLRLAKSCQTSLRMTAHFGLAQDDRVFSWRQCIFGANFLACTNTIKRKKNGDYCCGQRCL